MNEVKLILALVILILASREAKAREWAWLFVWAALLAFALVYMGVVP